MSVTVYTENWNGLFKKSTFEAVSYAYETAKLLGSSVTAISLGKVTNEELTKLGEYGASKILSYPNLKKEDSKAAVIDFAKLGDNTQVYIFSNSYTSKMIAPRLSAKLKYGFISNVISTPLSIKPITVKKTSFSSKAIEKVKLTTDKCIISISPNSYKVIKNTCNPKIELIESISEENIIIESQEKAKGKIALSEAEIIVSAGRGLKGPENWEMIEKLADLLGAATACSKPVSDIGWRPHSEHVGQTGKVVAPNLYIGIGISGAIQHLAGVNSSKVIVVINTDPEAPFFKAADYGIVGDAFEVVPKIIEEIQKINT